MSKRSSLAKEMRILEEEIKFLEIKRSRSLASLVEALVSKKEPSETDVQFFRTYSAEIDVKREHLQEIVQQLKGMI